MEEKLYFADVNDTDKNSRLFIKLNNGTIIYFGDNVVFDRKLFYPYSLYFCKIGEDKQNIYRRLELLQRQGSAARLIETIYQNGYDCRRLASYEYTLSSLIRNTVDQKLDIYDYWKEYHEFESKILVAPTFVTFSKKIGG